MRRRDFLKTGGGAAAFALAGCLQGDGGGDGTTTNDTTTDGETTTGGGNATTTGGTTTTARTTGAPSGTLNVATYSSFTGEGAAGNWLKSEFETEYPDATVEFTTPESGVNEFIRRKQSGADVNADLYVGLNTEELVRVDEKLDEQLFAAVESDLSNAGSVKQDLRVDPQGRAVPYDTGYISLVYNAHEVENPGTFDALLEERYRGKLIAQNAQQSDPGRAFLLWTIHEKGEDAYLDYWQGLVDNDVKILSDWEPAYNAYLNGEAPMVVSYSTDQVYYHGEDVDIQKHQVGFLNDQGYANPETMARFADASNPDLALAFMDFALTERAQAEIAVRNVQFPAVEGVDPGEEFSKYAFEPPNPVTFTYKDLAGKVDSWIDEWARQVASK